MASLLTQPTTQQNNATRVAWRDRVWWVVRILLDAGLVNAAFWVAYQLRYVVLVPYLPVPEDSLRSLDDFNLTRLAMTVAVVGALQFKGLYRLGRGVSLVDEMARLTSGITIGLFLTVALGVAFLVAIDSRAVLVYSWGLTIVGLMSWRLVARMIRDQLWQHGLGIERVVVVGSSRLATRVMQALADQRQFGYELVGFVDDSPMREELTFATQHQVLRARHLGAFHDLGEVVRRYAVDEVFLALPSTSHEQIVHLLATCRERAVRFKLVPDLFEVSFSQVQVDEIDGIPLIGLHAPTISGWDGLVKRAVDVALSLLILVVGAPVIALIALAIRLDSPGPILFPQVRIGKNGRPFTLYKFRSMYQDAEQRLAILKERNEAVGALFKIRDDPRRTRVGRLLRRTSLDELPQAINILRGEMSWVGPRPQLPSEVAQYQDWQYQRLEVTPGLTGLWQVSGRSDLTFEEMVLLDLYYAEHWSLGLDLKIMLRTLPAVLRARGAY